MKAIRPEVQKMMAKFHVPAVVATAIWEDGYNHGAGLVAMQDKAPTAMEPKMPDPKLATEDEMDE